MGDSSVMDAMASGLPPPTREILDLSKAALTKEPKKLTDKPYLSKEQYAQQLVTSQPDTDMSQAPAPAQYIPPQGQAPVLPAAQPPIGPNDSPRVQERINKLYRQRREAEERTVELEGRLAAAEGRLAETLGRLESRVGNYQPQPQNGGYAAAPYQEQQNFAPSQSQEPSAGGYVSRSELRQLLAEQTRALMTQNALGQAHITSRSEAERDFPEVFQRPDVKATADHIWSSDPTLRSDPMGPYKAAMMALGAHGGMAASAGGGVAGAVAQKAQLSGIGASVPEGTGTPEDRGSRYQAALARATRSGRIEDVVKARNIQLGIE